MPRPSMKAVPVTGVPIRPCSISRRASRPAAPRKVSGAEPSARPRAAAVTTSVRPASAWTASGFSVNTCFPAERACHRDVEMRGGDRQVEHKVDRGIGDERADLHRPDAEIRGAARGRVRVYVGAGDNLDAAEQRGIAQVGHRDVAAADDADPQARFTGLRHDPELTLGLRERKRGPCPRRVVARDPATLAQSERSGLADEFLPR